MNKEYYVGVDLANGPDVSMQSLVQKINGRFEYLFVDKPDFFKKCYGSNCSLRGICANYIETPDGYITHVDYQYIEGKGCEHFKEIEKNKSNR